MLYEITQTVESLLVSLDVGAVRVVRIVPLNT